MTTDDDVRILRAQAAALLREAQACVARARDDLPFADYEAVAPLDLERLEAALARRAAVLEARE